jgi:hypothetical protein
VDDTICYLNTDLVLTSANDLTALTAAFNARGLFTLRCDCHDDGIWYASFETHDLCHRHQPEQDIVAMLAVVESLDEPLRAVWSGCTLREFDIGYDCGGKPWAFNQGLTSALLGRMAEVGASLRITLYPPTCEKDAETGDSAVPPLDLGSLAEG